MPGFGSMFLFVVLLCMLVVGLILMSGLLGGANWCGGMGGAMGDKLLALLIVLLRIFLTRNICLI